MLKTRDLVFGAGARRLALAMGLAITGPTLALALNWQADPRYGTITLNANFSPDPFPVQVQAGGSTPASSVAPGCSGYVDGSRPDVDLNYTTGQFQLFISAWTQQQDITLVVYGPSGKWFCNDDFNLTDPALNFPQAPSGNYNIWIGTYAPNQVVPATLYFSESAAYFP